ncbi:adapter protein MecA 1/2 [Bacillus tianshenii]|uniref:Adapter protein MecA n=1 Tax=Sutcliffiella tianshenii TaxID=1463404 RepID=A0ABS2P167_9BACI|nr:adaptor protein MecA [Bacillus tianshenii]MBM7620619.1 adapter protein MecA 1/2 [Bacillus tianshenii]MCA1320067.1 adaptor protein MecA [Bacillus tianshenii]
MEIERINDHTVKFYISYGDIEERGFDREEIWYNRERSEELFWEMMDEAHDEEDFMVEGPLWIQVQALDKGLEVVVTRAQLSKDGKNFEVPVSEDKKIDIPVDERIEALIDQHFNSNPKVDNKDDKLEEETDLLQFMIRFRDLEYIISVSHRLQHLENLDNSLYFFEGSYYLYVDFSSEHYTDEEIDNVLSVLLEYGDESAMSIHRLQEYGSEVVKATAMKDMTMHFPLK